MCHQHQGSVWPPMERSSLTSPKRCRKKWKSYNFTICLSFYRLSKEVRLWIKTLHSSRSNHPRHIVDWIQGSFYALTTSRKEDKYSATNVDSKQTGNRKENILLWAKTENQLILTKGIGLAITGASASPWAHSFGVNTSPKWVARDCEVIPGSLALLPFHSSKPRLLLSCLIVFSPCPCGIRL